MQKTCKKNFGLADHEVSFGANVVDQTDETTKASCGTKILALEREFVMSEVDDVPPHPRVYLAPWQAAAYNGALDYAKFGWPVFPADGAKKGRKSAKHSNGRRWGATLDATEIMQDWADWPDSLIGVVTGHRSEGGAELVVLDIDTLEGHDVDGIGNLEKALKARGKSRHDLPITAEAATPTGGHHLYYRYPDSRFPLKFKKRLALGVDIQSDKQTIIAPPSYRPDKGRHYTWIASPAERGIAEIPDWLLDMLLDDEKPQTTSGQAAGGTVVRSNIGQLGRRGAEAVLWDVLAELEHTERGGRNDTLNRCAFILGTYVAEGSLDEERVWSLLMSTAKEIGLEDAEILSTINSGLSAGMKAAHQNASNAACACSVRDLDLSHDALAQDLGGHSFNDDARFVPAWGKWLFWAGSRWEKDRVEGHMSRTRDFLAMRADHVVQAADLQAMSCKPSEASELRRWARTQARNLRSRSTITAVETLARSNSESVKDPESFDQNMLLLGTPAGTVDLMTGCLRQAERRDLITKSTMFAPAEPGATPTLWLKFLDRIFAGDTEIITFMQRVAGYALTGLTTEHKLLFLYGGGRNGKGVFLSTLNQIWGDYSRNASASLFLASSWQQHPTGLAALQGARLVIGSEIPKGATWNEAIIKDLTGGDRINARFMRCDSFDFDPQLTLLIAGNEKPSLAAVDPAMRARMVLIPFNVEIPREEQDPRLKEKLMKEAPAILRWVIDGALQWQHRGLAVPECIRAASDAYLDDEDMLKNFLSDETVTDPASVITSAELYDHLKTWCNREGMATTTYRKFRDEMKSRGWPERRRSGGMVYIGLQLK